MVPKAPSKRQIGGKRLEEVMEVPRDAAAGVGRKWIELKGLDASGSDLTLGPGPPILRPFEEGMQAVASHLNARSMLFSSCEDCQNLSVTACWSLTGVQRKARRLGAHGLETSSIAAAVDLLAPFTAAMLSEEVGRYELLGWPFSTARH